MNKEVIYLEPEDDITDILTKLQRAEQKLVALVPPKKATMFRSAVNMKLVARAAKESKKIVVIVTADPAVSKMAMLAQIPVAKTLQSRPVVPTKESIAAAQANEQVIDEDLTDVTDTMKNDSAKTASEGSEGPQDASKKPSADTIEMDEESLEKGSKNAKNGQKSGKNAQNGQNPAKMAQARKWIILGVVVGVIAIVFGVWALVFAPAVQITVAMNTSSSNFSEDVRFVTDAAQADPAGGVLFAEQRTVSEKYSADVAATGHENQGEKATGEVKVTYTIEVATFIGDEGSKGFAVGIQSGDLFTTTDGLQFRAGATEAVKWDGENNSDLRNKDKGICDTFTMGRCVKTFTIPVTAIKAGEEYNLKRNTDWNMYEDIVKAKVTNAAAFTGGTTHEVTVVTQADVDKVKDAQVSEHTSEGREQLLSGIGDDLIVLGDSFKAEAGDVVATPAVGDAVGDNTKPNANITVKFSVYAVEKSQIDEYIKAKFQLPEDQKIYSIGESYFEHFTDITSSARLKAVIKTGPTVTEETILEKAKGRKIGEVQSLLRSINGVSTVEIKPSYFWVRTVPDDDSKVTIDLTVEDK